MHTKNILYTALLAAIIIGAGSCKKESEFLDVQPTNIFTNEQALSDPAQALSILANLYSRQLDISTVKSWQSMADFSESFPSQNGGDLDIVRRTGWGYGSWSNWDYAYIREMNLFLERCEAAEKLSADDKKRFLAEGRFLRANFYFELTKRMGGVPLVLESMQYDYKGDPTYLQHPRAKEAEMYDFVISEAEAIKMDLPADASVKSRASRGAALAMATRAALYAGSIAKYGVNTPQVSLPGGEVGIPAAKANEYYTKALTLAQEIIGGSAGAYALYNYKSDLQENFAAIFYDKGNNPESIFIEDFKLKSGKVHGFTQWNQPRFGAEEEEGGRINPSLNLVQSFEKLDNTFAPLPVKDGNGNPVYYDNQLDIFADRDARLGGTVILPGSMFKGRPVDIWAGYILGDGGIITGDDRGQLKPLPGTTTPVQIVGFDGPITGKEHTAQSGFYLRKYLDPAAGSGSRGTGSEVPFIRYRYAEVLLNAAEAAYELGQAGVAVGYMNEVRKRAGLVIPLAAGDITFDRIVHERRAELSFEGHVLFDNKRWRRAHTIWDGVPLTEADLLSDIGAATKRNTQPWALWPYKVHNPGSVNHGKWTYKVLKSSLVTGTNRFLFGNYYSFINNDIRSNNPKIVKQPNQD
ncbi:RagB/SusD family nutrient uptake outer membrane protein [Chitinophaga alhagiae]|uniref:RagB/SusD family nutrient uptake outer membrane protein n=1 Tax=Chitinophaga alhagiae TaxID=2203219 RepID=A0ABN5LRM2_9BACT|nr:RagB/SusD family nutrient uptake outer membrane protein [Chitinophaga alhagiae]AWO00818.1 RagB/SusD family nutrient uptake outer membrane protein [Chitinophaga alhagiae]